MSRIVRSFFILSFFVFTSANSIPDRGRERIDIVFCLDLSASTNGLIDDVRDRIWDMINHINSYKPDPYLRIGVVAFSRPSFGSKNNYVKVISDLTNDFDALAYELNQLRPAVEKGDQVVGKAIETAVEQMSWSKGEGPIKVIYTVGNGRVDVGGSNIYRGACESAMKEGITVHSVYCRLKRYDSKEIYGWREIAKISGGEFFDLRLQKRAPQVLVSDDQQALYHLSQDLNDTYIPFGQKGIERFKMMKAVDEYALKSSPMDFQSRLFYKISDQYQYHQERWDLVDYLKSSDSDFNKIDAEYLPDSLKSYSADQLIAVAQKAKLSRNFIINKLRMHLPYNRQEIIVRTYREGNFYQADIFDQIVLRAMDGMAASGGYNTGNLH